MEGGPGPRWEDPTPPLAKETLILLFVLQGRCPHGDGQIRAREMETEGGRAATAGLLIGQPRLCPRGERWPRGAALELWALGGYSGTPPTLPPLLPWLRFPPLQREIRDVALSAPVAFQVGAELSSLGPGLQRSAPDSPSGHSPGQQAGRPWDLQGSELLLSASEENLSGAEQGQPGSHLGAPQPRRYMQNPRYPEQLSEEPSQILGLMVLKRGARVGRAGQ